MADYRNVFALIAAVAFLQLSGGILGVVTPLGLEALGAGTLLVGVIAAIHAVGYMIGAVFSTRAISLFGNIRVFSAAAAVTACSVLLMHLALDIVAWTLVRLIQGAGFALMFSSAEAWMGATVPARSRGSVSGFYHLVAKIALVMGPFFVAGLAATDARPVLWCGVFLTLSLVPICLTRRETPPPPDTAALPLRELYDLAPAAVTGVFLAGATNSGIMALLPLYADLELSAVAGGGTQAAAIVVAAAWIGGVLSQWPAGRISDSRDRRNVIAVMGALASVSAFVLALVPGMSLALTLLLVALWGAGSLSFYSVAVAHAIDRAQPGQIASVMAGLLFVWAVGSVVGPLLAGASMRTELGASGLFLLASALNFLLVVAMIWRKRRRAKVPLEAHERWVITMPTLATKGEIDPRAQ